MYSYCDCNDSSIFSSTIEAKIHYSIQPQFVIMNQCLNHLAPLELNAVFRFCTTFITSRIINPTKSHDRCRTSNVARATQCILLSRKWLGWSRANKRKRRVVETERENERKIWMEKEKTFSLRYCCGGSRDDGLRKKETQGR